MEAEKKDRLNFSQSDYNRKDATGLQSDKSHSATQKWLDSVEYFLEFVLSNRDSEEAPLLVERLIDRLKQSGLKIPPMVNTPYINTIPVEKEPLYPGDREIERRIKDRRENYFGYVTLRWGLAQSRAWIRWADEILRELEGR